MQSLDTYMLPCLNKKLFGFDCPGCGLQRSFILVLQGDFTSAFHMYPAIFTLIIMLVFLVLHIKLQFKNGHKILFALFIINFIFIITNFILKFI